MAKILNTYLTDQCKTKTKVVDFHHPHQLEELLGDTLCVDGPPRDLHQVLSDCKETLKYCVKTGKPYPYISISSHRFTRPSLNKEICIVNTCKRRIDVMSYAYIYTRRGFVSHYAVNIVSLAICFLNSGFWRTKKLSILPNLH